MGLAAAKLPQDCRGGSGYLQPQDDGELVSTIIASPDPKFRRRVLDVLRSTRWTAEEAVGGAAALDRLEAGRCQVLMLDRWLPDLDVTELMAIVKTRYPHVEVFVVDSESGMPLLAEEPPLHSHLSGLLRILQSLRETATEDGDSAVAVQGPEFAPELSRDPDRKPAAREVIVSAPLQAEPLPGMIGSSPPMQRVYRLARLVAPRSTTVLVTGETGTGKELVARAIHQLGSRQKQPFITVNCAAIPESLLEAELFGYARGAFTGAFQSRLGRIHSAHGGTLFLDEVGELPLSMQAKLLRFLQEGEVQRLGSHDVVKVDVRVISASNADLQRRVSEGAFREDLYYRLAVFPIDLAPLRTHPEDILTLALSFLNEFCQEAPGMVKGISREAGDVLAQYKWPGNVRELRHVVERAFILSGDEPNITPDHISLQNRSK